MTAVEMQASFLVQYDAATSLVAPGWDNSEISAFLNLAQDNIVAELYNKKDLISISNIITTMDDFSLTTHPTITNAVYYEIDTNLTDFLYYVSSRTSLTRTNPAITREWIHNEVIDRISATKFFQTGLNKVWFKYPKVFFENVFENPDPQGNCMVVLYDSYTTPLAGEITYVKYPSRIDIDTTADCELNLVLHKDIVKLAVEEAVKAVKIGKVSAQ